MRAIQTESGKEFRLGRKLGGGGEGDVYHLEGSENSGLCAKLYTNPEKAQGNLEKLKCMLAAPPGRVAGLKPGHHPIAWPQQLLFAPGRKPNFLGFVMPRVPDGANDALLFMSPVERTKHFSGSISWGFLYRAACNFASALEPIHGQGHLVGDLNESNVMISKEALVTIIDCDSFEIRDKKLNRVYPCLVGKDEYRAPEMLLGGGSRSLATDNFALSVMLFQMLMNGFHPYSTGGGAPADSIRRGVFPYFRNREGISPPKFAPSFDIFHSAIQELFRRAFIAGHSNPDTRPTSREWAETLRRLETGLVTCELNPNHQFFPNGSDCPWCEAAKGGRDSFPPRIGSQVALEKGKSLEETLEQRLAFLEEHVIRIALVDGVMTPQEEELVLSKAKQLGISKSQVEKLIEKELGGAVAALGGGAGNGKSAAVLELDRREFEFKSLRAGARSDAEFEVRNVGAAGSVLTGSLSSDRRWLKVQKNLDPSKIRQPVKFSVDSAGLSWGLRDEGRISLTSSGGDATIVVRISIELNADALGRFRQSFVPLSAVAGAILGVIVSSIFGVSFESFSAALVVASGVVGGIAGMGLGTVGGPIGVIIGGGVGVGLFGLVPARIFDGLIQISPAANAALIWALAYGACSWVTASQFFRSFAAGRFDEVKIASAGSACVLAVVITLFDFFVVTAVRGKQWSGPSAKVWASSYALEERGAAQPPMASQSPPPSSAAKPKRTTASVIFSSDPSGATVLVDKIERGQTPFESSLPPGNHGVEVRHPNCDPHWDVIDAERGGKQNFWFKLENCR